MKVDIKEIESKCAEFEKMSYSTLMSVLMSHIYNCVSSDYQISSKERFAYAYAFSCSWIEYGCFDFDMIPKLVEQFLSYQRD